MTGVLLLPLIAWAIEDKRTLEIRYFSLIAGALVAFIVVSLSGYQVDGAALGGLMNYGLARLGLPDGDAIVLGYVGLILGFPASFLVTLVTFALLFTIPRERATDMPAIPLIAAVSGVVACGMTYWQYLVRA